MHPFLTISATAAVWLQPQAWLPVSLVQGRIEREITKNLQAVRISLPSHQFTSQGLWQLLHLVLGLTGSLRLFVNTSSVSCCI